MKNARKTKPTKRKAKRKTKPAADRLRITIDEAKIVAAVDSNVFLELYSWHDAANAAEKLPATLAYRYQRAGEALRLAIYLDKISALTWGLRESLVKMKQRVPPPPPPEPGEDAVPMTANQAYTHAFIWLVRGKVIPRWIAVAHNAEKKPAIGDAADQKILRKAKKLGVPLITGEGNSHRAKPKKDSLRDLAKAAGVPVFTPGEFVRGKLKPADIERFKTRFRKFGVKFHKGRADYDNGQALLDYMFRYLMHALEVTEQ